MDGQSRPRSTDPADIFFVAVAAPEFYYVPRMVVINCCKMYVFNKTPAILDTEYAFHPYWEFSFQYNPPHTYSVY